MNQLIIGDCRAVLRDLIDQGVKVNACVTSPPYWGLRDYGVAGQIGQERTLELYRLTMVEVFALVRQLLAPDATLWLNLGDSFANDTKWGGATGGIHASELHGDTAIGRRRKSSGLKPKDLCGAPWRVAFALQDAGWYLRSDIIWHKPSCLPESVQDRPTRAHEYLFLLANNARYFYDAYAVRERAIADHAPGNKTHKHTSAYEAGAAEHRTKAGLLAYAERKRFGKSQGGGGTTFAGHSGYCRPDGTVIGTPGWRNRRSVWTISAKPYPNSHFAVMPPELVEPCVMAATSEHGHCPACGRGWVRTFELIKGEPSGFKGSGFVTGKTSKARAHIAPVGVPPRTVERRHVGWAPSCRCGAAPVPAVVLDPFAGSGTTLQVAERLGRQWLGIELNPAYAGLVEERTVQAGLGI